MAFSFSYKTNISNFADDTTRVIKSVRFTSKTKGKHHEETSMTRAKQGNTDKFFQNLSTEELCLQQCDEVERMQSKALKQLLQVSISTSTAGVLMETGIWPAKQYLKYSTMILYHSITNSEE